MSGVDSVLKRRDARCNPALGAGNRTDYNRKVAKSKRKSQCPPYLYLQR
jgi:hypothetical protein